MGSTHDGCRFKEAQKDLLKVLELRPGHSSGEKELEQTARAGEVLEQATSFYDAEEFQKAEEALDKVLLSSSECSQVFSAPP